MGGKGGRGGMGGKIGRDGMGGTGGMGRKIGRGGMGGIESGKIGMGGISRILDNTLDNGRLFLFVSAYHSRFSSLVWQIIP